MSNSWRSNVLAANPNNTTMPSRIVASWSFTSSPPLYHLYICHGNRCYCIACEPCRKESHHNLQQLFILFRAHLLLSQALHQYVPLILRNSISHLQEAIASKCHEHRLFMHDNTKCRMVAAGEWPNSSRVVEHQSHDGGEWSDSVSGWMVVMIDSTVVDNGRTID